MNKIGFALLRDWKAQRKEKKIGFSYHNSAALLDKVFTAHVHFETFRQYEIQKGEQQCLQ